MGFRAFFGIRGTEFEVLGFRGVAVNIIRIQGTGFEVLGFRG